MAQISEDAVKEILAPYHDDLAECVSGAYRKYRKHVEPTLQIPSKRVRANCIYDYMVDDARNRFAGLPGVHVLDRRDRFLIGFGTKLLARFKKLNDHLMTSNYPTFESLRFDRQLPIDSVPPAAARVTIGYKLSNDTGNLESIHVVMIDGRRPAWSYVIDEVAEVVAIPTPTNENVSIENMDAKIIRLDDLDEISDGKDRGSGDDDNE